ncbi:MAG: Rpn family recombination-promoting nuclease/putative transposase [Chthoniobacterales bacterium]|nr:Rpn family recombination-promoting nuclease/putative transposase [Chthoniobacterales bacterium]
MNSKKLVRFDWAIKTLLRNKVNFPILAGFLSELLHTDVTIESLLESESNKKDPQDKSNRVDVFAKLANGERVIIEVQCEHEWDFLSRMLYGVSKVVVEHLKEGDPYGLIPRVISVNIVYFDLGHGEDYIYHGMTQFRGIYKDDTLQLGELEKKHYPDHIDQIAHILPEYYVLKVDKFDLKVRNTLDEWIYALQQSEVKPEFRAKGIRQAANQLGVMNLSEEERRAYERHIGDVRISKSTLETSFTDGLLQGEAKGRTEGVSIMIRNMHHSGLEIAAIAKIARLSQQEVEQIIASAQRV